MKLLSPHLKETAYLRAFGFWKIPLIFLVSPSVLEMSDDRVVVKIPLKRVTRNHLKSMYFGVLAVGADVSGGLLAMRKIQESGDPISLIFKDFRAEFLKRAEGDVHFTCEQGKEIAALVEEARATGERVELPVHLTATVPTKLGQEPVARFVLTLSLKKKS